VAAQDDRLGEVRGTGLLAGIDLLAGPQGAPNDPEARPFARAVLDALAGHRVLAGRTGPAGTVLKIRPPLVWREEHADQFAAALAAALTDLA